MLTEVDRARLVTEHATDMVAEVDPDGVWVWVSSSVTGLLGWDPCELVGQEAIRFIHPDDVARGLEAAARISAGERLTVNIRVRRKEGGYHWVSSTGIAVVNEQGVTIGRLSAWRDVQSEVELRQALKDSEERYRLLAENAADLIWQSNLEGVIQWVSPSVKAVLGWSPEDVIGHQSLEFINMLDHAAVLEKRVLLRAGTPVQGWEGRYRCADDNFRWMSAQARPMFDAAGAVTGLNLGLRDVHEQVLAREALARSERKFRIALDGAPQGMAIVSLNRDFTTVNDSLCRITGRSREWLLSHGVADVLSPEDNEADLLARDALLAGQGEHRIREVQMVTPDGQRRWVIHSIGLLREDDGMPMFYVSQYQDVSEHHRVASELAHRAEHDQLTGLLTREVFLRKSAERGQIERRSGGQLALIFFDLDRFKDVNDTFGHAAGDVVLAAVADRIRASLRASDLVARLGGDEFVAAAHEVGSADAAIVLAEKIRARIAEPIALPEGPDIVVTASAGTCFGVEDVQSMIEAADRALYIAKSDGRDRVRSSP